MQTNPEQATLELLNNILGEWRSHGIIHACIMLEAAFAEREARLVGALEQIATVDMGGGFLGAQACRKVALAALKDRTHG